MRYSTSLFILMLLISTTVGTFAHSEDKMDISTITTVIKKLKGALKLVDDKTVKHAVLAVRIADLYAERARLESMKAIEEDCSKCNKDFKDRSKALNYYEGAFEKLDSDTQNMVLFQMAHLYKLTNQTSRAEKLFNDVLKNQKAYPRELITEAQIGLGEIYYFKGDYKKSLVYFALAEKDRSTPKQGYIAFRLAWCHFNLGHDTLAKNYLIGILKSQEMLSRTLPNGDVVIDNSFHQDVAKDLTTFTARSSVRTSDINNIIDLSPDDRRRENLYFLGTETARLGKKQESLLVWDTFLASEHSTPSEKVDISLRLAQLTYDSGQFTNALSEYQDSLKLFQKHGCEDKSIGCDSIQARYRDFVTNWNKHEKAKPSINLLEAYIAYCETFPGDQQMLYWTAQVAQTNKKASTADKYYRLAAQAEDVKANIFNGSLLGAIETAESTNNPEKKLAAYNLYLKENPKGDKVLEVRYQRAHTYYELKDYKKASSEFTSIAREYKSSKSPLPLNSADLALDTLVILKDHEEVRDLAVEFASLYPQRKNEFHTISSVAITNIAGLVNDDKSSSQSEMRSALNSLQKIPNSRLPEKDEIRSYKIQLDLAEKTKNLDSLSRSARKLLTYKSLTNSEKLKIKEKLAWSEEMALNFKSAYALYSELLEGRQPRDKNALKLALLADLAGRNSTRHYQDFIKYTRSRKEANLVRAQLIEKSRSPWNDLLKEIRPLSSTPDLLASLTLSIYSKYKNDRQLKRVLQASRIENYQEGKSLVRKSDIPQIERAARNLRNHRITARSQYLLNKSIGRRMTLIQSMEKLADQAIRSRDWLLQATTIEILKNEYARLTNDLIALPVPKNLNAAQRKQYDRSFTAQLAPLKSKTSAFAKKADEFWSNKSAIKKMTSLYEESSIPVRRFLARELRFASNIAPSSVGRSIRSSLESSIDQPSRSAVNQAWQNLKDDPFSVSKIEKLRKLESQRGSDSVVAYLDSRKKVLEGTN